MFEHIYDCPIETQISQLRLETIQAHNQAVIRAVGQIGVTITEDGLLAALNQDKARYEEAYKRGWADCEEKYKSQLERIKRIAETEVTT